MTAPPSPVRPRVSGRDILPILATGLVVAGGILAAGRTVRIQDIAGAVTMGVGFMLALAGLQGRSATLTPRAAVIGWVKLTFITLVVVLATGRLGDSAMPLRLGIFVVVSLGASLLLFLLRTRRP
jgi:hypothetical protein